MKELENWLNTCISWRNMAGGNVYFNGDICCLDMYGALTPMGSNSIHISNATTVAECLGVECVKTPWEGNKYSETDKYDKFSFEYCGYTFYSLKRRS